MTEQKQSLLKDRYFRTGLISTILSFLACLSVHIFTILGVTTAVAWIVDVERALLFATAAFFFLTVYAVIRHRQRKHIHS